MPIDDIIIIASNAILAIAIIAPQDPFLIARANDANR
jgi:hypothetical protein